MRRPFARWAALLAWSAGAWTSTGGAQAWRALPNAPTSARIDDVFFIDDRMGWTCANQTAYRTLDGGATWQSFPAPGVSMRSIAFATPSHGWIGSVNVMTPLWASVDSGKTWSTVSLPEPHPVGICGLSAVNPRVVVGCGRFNGFPRFIKTTDGGNTWSCFDLSAHASRLIDCRFTDPETGIVVGGVIDGGFIVATILRTTDGGETWSARHTGRWPNSWGWKISFPTPQVGYVSVQQSEGNTHCLKTEDGGLTWAEVEIAATALDIQGIGFATETLGWATGGFSDRRTVDGGVTWERDRFGVAINRIRFLSPTLAYASGRTIYKYAIPTPVTPATVTAIKRRYR